MAVGEALTNLLAAPVQRLEDIKLSANWMAAVGDPGEDAALYDAVHAVGMQLCPALGLSIPVGKDSMSMQVRFRADGRELATVAPVSLVVSAFARVDDVRQVLTPLLDAQGGSTLWHLDLAAGRRRLGGSALAQAFSRGGGAAPDLDDPALVRRWFDFTAAARAHGLLAAWHDVSDGGLLVTLAEMAFASHCGLDIALDGVAPEQRLPTLFAEELGVVVQVRRSAAGAFAALLDAHGLAGTARPVATPTRAPLLRVLDDGAPVAQWSWPDLMAAWTRTSHAIARRRDDPACADEEQDARCDFAAPGLVPHLAFDPGARIVANGNPGSANADPALRPRAVDGRPQVAILREQGVNGQVEMAAAFERAGFRAIDVHMSDLAAGRRRLDRFQGLAACGGFSYGDVLGAGRGWATSILENDRLRDAFAAFFADPASFTLGVCNGCQMLAQLAGIIPGTGHWPLFARNRSEQYEARLSLVEVVDSPSWLLAGMAGSRLPVAVAHGEGRAEFGAGGADPHQARVCLRFVEGDGAVARRYPANPNGSPDGITGLCSDDGRVTIVMPHPERVVRTAQLSWAPSAWGEASPWQRLFDNARRALA
jgi:phosphoribosylformylglycinamidine synthase